MGFSGSTDRGGGGARQEIIARIEEMKAAPHHGQKRLVIRESNKSNTHAVIDIDMKDARELQEKGTYRFQVEEKHGNRPGQHARTGSSGFKSYASVEAPEKFDGQYTNFDRFRDKETGGRSSRTRF